MTNEDAENDIIQFFGKFCYGDRFFNQVSRQSRYKEIKKSHLTQSNHYRYNRMREGGWGQRGPLVDNRKSGEYKTQLSKDIINQLN